jgi:signal transduction histidine kinase
MSDRVDQAPALTSLADDVAATRRVLATHDGPTILVAHSLRGLTADEARRRIGRDLHDGAQQALIHTVITLRLARQELGDRGGPAVQLVDEALEHAERATVELRELAHGILPEALTCGGLRAAIDTLTSHVRLPVSLDVTAERLSAALEATAYFIVSEALTNVVKHASAGRAEVTAFVDGGALHLEVRDDGVGGARIAGTSGLLGLYDRATAMNGELNVESPPGGGTVVAVTLPIPRSVKAGVPDAG